MCCATGKRKPPALRKVARTCSRLAAQRALKAWALSLHGGGVFKRFCLERAQGHGIMVPCLVFALTVF